MATHLSQQAQRRHEEYMKAEISSLRESLHLAQQKLDSTHVRLDAVERLVLQATQPLTVGDTRS